MEIGVRSNGQEPGQLRPLSRLSQKELEAVAATLYHAVAGDQTTAVAYCCDGLVIQLAREYKGYRLQIMREDRWPDFYGEYLPVGAALRAPVEEMNVARRRQSHRQAKTGRVARYYVLETSWRSHHEGLSV